LKKIIHILLFLVFAAGFYRAQSAGTDNVKAELISEVKSVKPGKKFWVAVKLDMADQWHTYWRNPGDAGLPTKIDWSLPGDFTVSGIYWPCPELFESGGVVSYGYKDQILLLSAITPPAGFSGDKVIINAGVSWLECREICLPGGAELSLTLPVKDEPEPDDLRTDSFADARSQLPVRNKTWDFSSTRTDSSVIIQANVSDEERLRREGARFLPYEEGIYNNSKPQKIDYTDKGFFIEVMFADFKLYDPEEVRGIIKIERPDEGIVNAIEITVPVTEN
jgi:thiol:disulfide interchange protein DsbD